MPNKIIQDRACGAIMLCIFLFPLQAGFAYDWLSPKQEDALQEMPQGGADNAS